MIQKMALKHAGAFRDALQIVCKFKTLQESHRIWRNAEDGGINGSDSGRSDGSRSDSSRSSRASVIPRSCLVSH